MLRGLLNRRVLVVGLVLVLLVGGYGGYRVWRHFHVPLADFANATIEEPEVGGQESVLVSSASSGDDARPLAVLLHGVRDDERVATAAKAEQFTQSLVDAGWLVAASDAHGDAWGSPQSQRDYLDLIAWVRERYEVSGVVLVSVSMGGVAGLHLAAAGDIPDLLGWVGITPVTNLPAMAPDDRYSESIKAALNDSQVADLDPLAIDPARLTGVPMTIIASPTDDATPPTEQVEPFTQRFPGVRVVDCTGGHTAPDCYRADEVLALAQA